MAKAMNPPSYDKSVMPFTAYFREHRIIGIYNTSWSDFLLSTHADAPAPLNYVSKHGFGGTRLELHATGEKISPVICTADFHVFSSTTDISTAPGALGPAITERFEREGILSYIYVIHLRHPETGTRERFEWKSSRGTEVQSLKGDWKGLKLVRVATGEIVAAYTGVSFTMRKVGKMEWLSKTDLGETGYIMVLMSLFTIVERLKEARSSSSSS